MNADQAHYLKAGDLLQDGYGNYFVVVEITSFNWPKCRVVEQMLRLTDFNQPSGIFGREYVPLTWERMKRIA